MRDCHKILFQSFVMPFYRENAGAFLFFIILLFCIIGKVDGAELFEYHLSLATGILQNFSFLLLVLFAWLVYTRKFVKFVSDVIRNPQFGFLHVYNQLSRAKRFRLFFVIEGWLLAPILLYCIFLFYVTLGMHSYLSMTLIGLYLLLIGCMAALRHVRQLDNMSSGPVSKAERPFIKWKTPASYKTILLHFIIRRQLIIWAGIKLFTCGILYLIDRNNTADNYDMSMPFIFYAFGILANGVLILRIRAFEERYLSFYKGLAVPFVKTFLNYCFIYALLLIPEMVTVISLSPTHLYYTDAIGFILSGFSMLLFMNSVTFLEDFTTKEYLEILFALFLLSCICFTTAGLYFLSLLLVLLATLLLKKRYYQFERKYNTT